MAANRQITPPHLGLDGILQHKTTVTAYPYRTAKVWGTFLRFDRRAEGMYEIEEQLAAMAGMSHPDNHICYRIQTAGYPELYIMCSDDMLKVGTAIEEKYW